MIKIEMLIRFTELPSLPLDKEKLNAEICELMNEFTQRVIPHIDNKVL